MATSEHSELRSNLNEDESKFFDSVVQFVDGKVSVDALVQKCDEILRDRELYPPEPILHFGIRLGETVENSPGPAVEVSLQLISSPVRATRAVAVGMIFRLARFQPGFWVDSARMLITDDDWEVRDLAARIFDDWDSEDGAVEYHTSFVLEVVSGWVCDNDERIRRAATYALLGYAQRHSEIIPQLLDILNPLMADSHEYVRGSMATALRTLGRTNSKSVLDFIEKSLENPSDLVCETIRLSLDRSFADRFPERKARILERLDNPQ